MSPEFAAAFDPVIIETLRFKESIERGAYVTGEGYHNILRRIEAAESKFGDDASRKLTKLALCVWIDSLFIEYTDWNEKNWWLEHCLEVSFFRHRRSYEQFFEWAREAGALSNKDALEAFYIVVVLGYRGLYDNTPQGERLKLEQRLPATIEEWCKTTAGSLRLRQGRPPIHEVVQVSGTFEPLRGRATLTQYSMIGIVLAAGAIGLAIVRFGFLTQL